MRVKGVRFGMNNELQTILSYMERERGIDRETLIEAVEYALQSASRRTIEGAEEPRIDVVKNRARHLDRP